MSRALCEHVRFQARLRPGALAVFGPAGPIAYEALVRDVDALATELLERGLTRQDVVGVEMGFSYLHLLLILALDRVSIPSMSFASRRAVPASAAELARYGVTTIVSGDPGPADPACRWITMPEQHRPKLGAPNDARLAQLDFPADGLVRLIWSSGTTGGVKGSPLSRAIQLRRMANHRLACGIGPRSRCFTGMPFSSNPGYMRLVAVLAAGGAMVLPTPPADFVGLANTVGVTMTCGSPSMLVELLGNPGAAPRRLETMVHFEVLGEHLPAKLALDARRFLTPHIQVTYGSTEADRVATIDAACIVDPTVVGFVAPWIDLEIADPTGRPLADGQEGMVRMRGPQVVMGYYNSDAGVANFRDGWFYPGDIGSVAADGLLRVTGRIEDVIVRDGVAGSPVALESLIRSVPGIRDVAVFALSGTDSAPEICAALVLDVGAEPSKVQRAIREQLGAQAPARLFVLDSLPRNANGKVLRRDLADMARRSAKSVSGSD